MDDAAPTAPAPAPAAALAPATEAQRQLTCFVVTGFGNKTDYATGRVLNLDKTFEQLVQPACDAVNVNAFRAIDANVTGSIDSIMYRWIYQADLVIADLSTLNANVFYELGVRHAQRPNTTIIIAESVLLQRIPFDLSTFVVHQYAHGGDAIAPAEAERFVAHLAGVMRKIIEGEQRRLAESPGSAAHTDSPVYQFLGGMTPPAFGDNVWVQPPAYVPPAQRKQRLAQAGDSLGSIISAAEAAKNSKNFAEAIRLFKLAIQHQTTRAKADGKPEPKPDVHLVQRLALVTYKHGERKGADGQIDKAVAVAALNEAEDILARYCAPKLSNDPETLGLSGAINKRLFELTDDPAYLDNAIRFYERGFYVKRDYYNGINVAYMYNQKANLQASRFDAIVCYGHANLIRQLVVEMCNELINDQQAFAQRGDQEWVYLTLAEAHLGLGRPKDEERLAPKIAAVATDFGRDAYARQRANLVAAIQAFQAKVRPETLEALPAAAAPVASAVDAVPMPPAPAAAAVATVAAPSGAVATVEAPSAAAVAAGRHPITVDAPVLPGRVVKSIEVHCKVEYL